MFDNAFASKNVRRESLANLSSFGIVKGILFCNKCSCLVPLYHWRDKIFHLIRTLCTDQETRPRMLELGFEGARSDDRDRVAKFGNELDIFCLAPLSASVRPPGNFFRARR